MKTPRIGSVPHLKLEGQRVGCAPSEWRYSQQLLKRRRPQAHKLQSNASASRQLSHLNRRLWPSHQKMQLSSRGPKRRVSALAGQMHAKPATVGSMLVSVPAMLMAACTTLVFLAAAALCVFLIMRPLLKRLESLAVACEAAAKEVQKASAEFALASVVINTELPTTLDSMERASLEFEELGQSLNGLTGALRRTKPNAGKGARGKADSLAKAEGEKVPEAEEEAVEAEEALREWSAVEAIQASTVNSMRKVAQDVSALAMALTPAMVAWRKRLGFITERFESAPKTAKPKELPAAASRSEGTPRIEEAEAGPAVVSDSKEDSLAEGGGDQNDAWAEDMESLQKRVMSHAEHGEVSSVANELARAATEVTDMARASLSSTDSEDTPSELGLSPQQHREGSDLLEKAAIAAQALTREAQKAAEVESKFKAFKDIAPLPEDLEPVDMPAIPQEEDDGGLDKEMEDRRQAAQAVFAALANAEEAASAAAAASGALETALQTAERQAGISWWGWNHALFRQPSKKKKPPKAEVSETQEHDGMAYPCSRYIANREMEASNPPTDSAPAPDAEPSKK